MPDSTLRNVSDWDSFLALDSDSTELPIQTADQFILNENYHRLVLASRLPRPSIFIEQSVSFCKAFCKQLMTHDIVRSDLLRGLSAFDSPVILESPEDVYVSAIEKLSTHFVANGLISASDKVKAVSQYRSSVSILCSGTALNYDDWIKFPVTHYEVQCRPELLQLFRLSCLCLAPIVDVPPFLRCQFLLWSPIRAHSSHVLSVCRFRTNQSHMYQVYSEMLGLSAAFFVFGTRDRAFDR